MDNLVAYVILFLELAIFVAVIAGMWKTFAKAGKPGWGAFIPFYNMYLLIKIAGKPGWWLLLFFVPFVAFVVWVIVALDIAKNFGKGLGFGLVLMFFPVIGYLVLGFGDAEYSEMTSSEVQA